MPIAKLIKPVKVNNVTTSIKEFGDGDSFTLKGDGSSETAELVLNNPANTFSTKLKGANVTSNITFTLPDNDGASGQLLRTDGSGNLTFVNDANATELANDSTPQLGGNLDVNSNSIVSVSNGNISVLPNGTGKVLVDGDGTTGGISLESGSIDLKNSGSVSNLKLYCESSNSHYSQIQSAPHSAYSGNVTLTLPTTSGNLLTADVAQELAGGSVDFVATGSISSGDIVGLRSDGTVEVISNTATNYSTSVGTSVVFDGNTYSISSTFDSNTNKVVIAYPDAGNSSYGTAVVGTVSGTSISFGSPVVFRSASSPYTSTTFDSNTNKVVIAYRDDGNANRGTAVVGTVSGTSISFGTPVVFESADTIDISATFDSNSNKVVIAYKDNGNSGFGTAVVGTVSGTSISFGTPVVFNSANTIYTSATFDSNSNKVVIAYQDAGNAYRGTAVVGTVSGTTISFGTPVLFNNANSNNVSVTFDSNSNKVVIAYTDSGNSAFGTAIVGTVSGTSISFGSSVVFESANSTWISTTFDSNTNKVVIAYNDPGNFAYGTVVVGNVSGTSISFDTPGVFRSATANYNSTTFDSNSNKVVIAYSDNGNSNYGTATVFQAGGTANTTNADSWIGIAAENISDTASGKINILSGINENQTGLTINTDYYVNYDGTLTATENAGPTTGTYGKIGRALSSTNLLITSGND
jgi:hypothetical protein